MKGHRERLRRFVDSDGFQHFIIALIVINSITIGFETSDKWMNSYGRFFDELDFAILVIFIIEIVLRIYAYGWKFFKSAWNIFDFLIVAIAAIPALGSFSVFRTLRILRTLRLLKNIPKLRLIIESLLKSVPSIGWIFVLLLIVFYIFAVIGTHLYGHEFPVYFGTIGNTMFTLFQVMTLESWSSQIARPVMDVVPHSYLFFIPFILIATYTTLNIFIAIVVNTMNELHHSDLKKEEKRIKKFVHNEHEELLQKLEELKTQMTAIERKMQ